MLFVKDNNCWKELLDSYFQASKSNIQLCGTRNARFDSDSWTSPTEEQRFRNNYFKQGKVFHIGGFQPEVRPATSRIRE
jgi:hypothetical protein